MSELLNQPHAGFSIFMAFIAVLVFLGMMGGILAAIVESWVSGKPARLRAQAELEKQIANRLNKEIELHKATGVPGQFTYTKTTWGEPDDQTE